MTAHLGKLILLAILYIATGKLGLLLAVPPGYATVIWPPSGIALGMLIIHGWRLWPGILIGSFILNCYISGAWMPDTGFIAGKAIGAFGIALGSTAQALAGRALIARFIGLPLKLDHVKEVFRLFLLAGPVACLIAATAGIGTLYYSGVMPAENIANNWLAWWAGDMFGILVFLPLMLVMPGNPNRLVWQGSAVSGLPTMAMLVLIMPLGLTFYAWKIASENVYQKSLAEFDSLSLESEKALQHRLDSYDNALLGGVGFFQGSSFVSRDEWKSYVDTIELKHYFPGISGIGFIQPVQKTELEKYLRETRKDGAPDFKIHPETTDKPYYIIHYIEPGNINRQARGLNIAFENNRREAAEKARDTGTATITKKITLVQDEEKTPGFLLMHPMYRQDMPSSTPAERRAALKGWIYAPFVAKNFLQDLTRGQGSKFNLRIYDGDSESPDALIYSSGPQDATPGFAVRKHLELMQQKWLVVWESTPIYEQNAATDTPIFILVGGLLFTGLFGLFLIVVTVRRTETMEWMTGERKYVLPLTIFAVMALGSYALHETLKQSEAGYITKLVEDEANKVEALLTARIESRFSAIKRLAQRWEKSGGTPYELWQDDATHYTEDFPSLKAMEWVDPNYHIRWVVPLKGNEKAVGLNILFDDERKKVLEGAAERNTPTLTPPLDLVQGYKGFVVYFPLTVKGKFDGFMAGVFSLKTFFDRAITKELGDSFTVKMSYGGKEYYASDETSSPMADNFIITRDLQVYDKKWTLHIAPTATFIKEEQTSLPTIVLVAGLLIAALSALSVRSVLIARLRAVYLETSNRKTKESEERYDLVVRGMSVGLWDWNVRTNELYWSQRFKDMMGITDKDFKPHYDEFADRLHPDDKEATEKMLFDHVKHLGPYDVEYRLKHNNGDYIWIHAYGQAQWDETGNPIRMAGSVDDISARKQAQQELNASEETFRSAMEFASSGMALVALDGKWLTVNPALCKLVGYTREELLKTDFQSITHKDDLPAKLENIRRLLAGEIQNYQMEKRYIHKNGSIIWVLANASLAHNADGTPKHFVIQVQDITSRREMERMKNEFISTVSHELRTPLTSIRGALGLIEGGAAGEIPAKTMNLVQIAHKNSQRLVHIINDILDIEKIESGKLQVNIRKVALAPFLQQVLEANQPYGDKFKIRFVLESNSSGDVLADPDRLMQVMANLLSNAAKFSPEASQVIVRAHRINGKMRIEVQDHGNGIPEEFRTRIFGKFAQADSSDTKRREGTGLGLSIAKQLVELMNGDIGFETETGKGTTFFFHLPEAKSDFSVLAENSCYRLLLVEDDDTITVFLRTVLEQAGFMVDVAHNIPEAGHKLENGYYAAMILDLLLPLGDGLEFLREIRMRPATKDLPVIVVSAKAEEGKKRADKSLNVADWLAKPVDAQKIMLALQRIIAGENHVLPHVLHVEDDQDLTHVLAQALHGRAVVVSAPTLAVAKHYLAIRHFDLAMLDLALPDGSGAELLDALKAKFIPTIILSANETPDDIKKQVAISMVKSRMSESKIVDTILAFLPDNGPEKRRVS